MPQKLEITLYGLKENSEQTMILDPVDAFGLYNENLNKTLSKKSFPNQEMIEVGNVLEVDAIEKNAKSISTFAMIKEVNETDVLLDMNHPLAGQQIKFKVHIIKIYE